MENKNKVNIVGFLGSKHVGKDTAGSYLIEKFEYKRYAFGDPVKQICKNMFNLSEDQLNNPRAKETIDPRWGISPRTMFQRIGTEFGQVGLYKLFPELKKVVPYRKLWVKLFEDWVKKNSTDDKIVITDIRFQHELISIKENGGIIIKVNRDTDLNDDHISEREFKYIDKSLIDYEIDNNYTVDDLYSQLDTIIYVPF